MLLRVGILKAHAFDSLSSFLAAFPQRVSLQLYR